MVTTMAEEIKVETKVSPATQVSLVILYAAMILFGSVGNLMVIAGMALLDLSRLNFFNFFLQKKPCLLLRAIYLQLSLVPRNRTFSRFLVL